MSKKTVLVLGGTGAMGTYLVPLLLEKGYKVDVVSLDDRTSDNPDLTYTKANAKDLTFLAEILKKGYDGVVDFMSYLTEEFRERYMLFLENTKHYLFLSSCRIYSDDPVIVTEQTPRLLEASTDKDFLATEDYALFKAREEDMLRNSGLNNWSIIRPATTYSQGRLQLVTLEANVWAYRMLKGQTVVIPEAALNCQATLSWGYDAAREIAGVLFKEKALGEAYNVCSAEHHSWKEIAEMYVELGGLKYVAVPVEDYLNIVGPGSTVARYQLIYARLFNRVTSNEKVLELTGLTQESMTPLRVGVEREIKTLTPEWAEANCNREINARMDAYLKEKGIE